MKNTPGLADFKTVTYKESYTFISFLTQNTSCWRTGRNRIFQTLISTRKAQIKGSPGGCAKDRLCQAKFEVWISMHFFLNTTKNILKYFLDENMKFYIFLSQAIIGIFTIYDYFM